MNNVVRAVALLALAFIFSCSSEIPSNNSESRPNINSSSEISSSGGGSGGFSSPSSNDNGSTGSSSGNSGESDGFSSPSSNGNGSTGSSSSFLVQSSNSVSEGCEDIVFNPSKSFCYENNVYSKCNRMVYNPTTHICQGTVANPAKCNGIQYNPLEQRCQNNVIENKCGTGWYNPSTQSYCSNGTVKSSITDNRDSKSYTTVVIGTQTWMAENLNYYDNVRGLLCYDSLESNCDKYGRLYSWATAKTACPSGWHLPSRAEWDVLITYAGGRDSAGIKLKATSGWNSNGNGTDDYGFAALPGGGAGIYYNNKLGFYSVGNAGYWWSASECNNCAYGLDMSYGDEYAETTSGSKSDTFFSVRCVKN